MAKGGNNQRSNGSRFSKPYDVSNSFVKKVALRVSDYLGGLFGSSVRSDESFSADAASYRGTDNINITHTQYGATDSGKAVGMTRCYEELDVSDSPGKRLKIGSKRKFVPDLPISPIGSSTSLFQSSVNHNFDIQNSDDFITSVAGPSGLQNQKYAQTSSITTPTSTNTNLKANGATDNHSDSSESTSGCSSLVPQSDRLSQSAFVSNTRKKILEEKLQYARQLKQTRASMYLNRSIPVLNETTGSRRKPSFDVSVYGSPIIDKSSVREKMVSSPFYTGQTSYGGASAYRRPRTALYSQQCLRTSFDRKDGLQMQVKPSHYGSTEDLSNMSHTAKRILEALEQFSTPVSDAKRIPVNAGSPPLGKKRKLIGDSTESAASLTSKANATKGPLISGLSIPTVPDLLKLKRLEKIQDSTAAARQVAVQKQEYSLPTDVQPCKHSGKIVTKMKDKEKEVTFERPPEVNLPKIPLPISTLPKFDLNLPPITTPTVESSASSKPVKTATTVNVMPSVKLSEPNKSFKFSPPITLPVPQNVQDSAQKSNFTFSTPLKADLKSDKSENAFLSNLSNFMSAEAFSKLKRKSITDKPNSAHGVFEPAKELKAGSVMELLRKTLENNKKAEPEPVAEQFKPLNDTWECGSCLIRNINDNKNCSGCKAPKASVPSNKITKTMGASPVQSAQSTDSKSVNVESGFGNKFKPPSGSWSCKECFVNNNATATKCIACESPKPQSNPVKETTQAQPPPIGNGFGDLFKKKADQWECPVCMIQNKESVTKCAACETPKPGAKSDKPEPPKFSFGIPAEASGFKFGIDKADVKSDSKTSDSSNPVTVQPNGPRPESAAKPLTSVATSFGVFTFGIPPAVNVQAKNEKESDVKVEVPKKTDEPEKVQNSGVTDPPTKTDTTALTPKENSVSAEKITETEEKVEEKKIEEVNPNDSSKSNAVPANNFMMKSFSFQPQTKVTPGGLFSFGSSDNTGKPSTTSENVANNTNSVFGSTLKMPEVVPSSSTGFTFQQPNPVSSQLAVNTTSGSMDTNRPTPFPKFSYAGKIDAVVSTSASIFAVTKPSEKLADTTSASATSKPATSSIFGSSLFKDSKVKHPFGGSNIPEFGGSNKSSTPGEMPSVNVVSAATPFPTPTQTFSAATSVFNGPAASSATNSFGSLSSAATPFTASTAQEFTSNTTEQGFRPATQPSFTSSVPSFGSPNNQMTNFRMFSSPKNFGSPTAFGSNSSALGSAFGQPASAPEKPLTPFMFGEGNNNAMSTSAPAPPTTAPNVFTFGAPKPEAKAPQFPTSSGFGQSSGAFTFGTPSNNIFGNFNQPKTANPFGTPSAGFGAPAASPFGQNSAPAGFGGSAPKFEFGQSSQQTQSTPQPFQFGAVTPQTQANSAPATTFSISVPQTFNFTGGQAPVGFSATQTTSAQPQRKLAKAFRRTQR